MEEECGNRFEKQQQQQQLGIGTTSTMAEAETKVGKPPTRLQKHAPASLMLDQMKAVGAGSGAGLFGPPSPAAIPLLSPLILSPHSFPDTLEEFRFPTWNNTANSIPSPTPASAPAPAPASTPTAFGWKHPSVSGYVEPSALFALFQTKCLLVNDA